MSTNEVDWDHLNKKKFFVYGVGIFTGLTTCLFPLTVVKTRMMAHSGPDAPSGVTGAWNVARTVTRTDGIRGLYKGFGTVIAGMIPGRMLYMTGLESAKAGSSAILHKFNLSDTTTAGAANFVAGAVGSLSSQLVVVPVDVISQRLMIQDTPKNPPIQSPSSPTERKPLPSRKLNGFQMARDIIAKEGVAGLYRGFGASIATFVPSSALWWASYGAWQSVLWHQIDIWQSSGDRITYDNNRNGSDIDRVLTYTDVTEMNQNNNSYNYSSSSSDVDAGELRSEGQILIVQVSAGILTGCTTGAITTPLDTIKVRMQTMSKQGGGGEGGSGRGVSFRSVAGDLLREQGVPAFFRGAFPRMTSMSIWGTAMVSAYEFLKRLCQK